MDYKYTLPTVCIDVWLLVDRKLYTIILNIQI